MEHWVRERGSLADVALRVSVAEGLDSDLASVERALRRLRKRGQLDGGAWGQRLLRVLGVPTDVERRVRWMGVYHGRFTDLPVSLCLEQLRLWDRPPVSESPARVWIELGFATCALRTGDHHHARARLSQSRLGPPKDSAARLEQRLLEAFLASKDSDHARAVTLLSEVPALLDAPDLPEDDRACFRARWLDQAAFQALHPPPPSQPDLARARSLYERIAVASGPPFALAKREGGLAYVCHRLGDAESARAHAEAACRHAGDGGFVRMRATYLGLLAHVLGPGPEADAARARAVRAAGLLEDEELSARLSPPREGAPAESARPPRRRAEGSPGTASPAPRTRTTRRRP